ncbi:hypothetical protein LEWO105114_09095 [Legionella worsleiensis]|uniref:Ankyrin repeat-containing protein n=2 Tax=Legionella worsleiensis TaxID=45076 RepID=A0A0W1AJ11_9GAMM|nr:ankyrin repeat-containing protein [Legionella worsleiensis]STY33201.1 ankyrin repeat-containing protein [Legionella worsleiensis]
MYKPPNLFSSATSSQAASSSSKASDDLHSFLTRFPSQEFWRFFVERVRYDIRPAVYRNLYYKFTRSHEETSLAEIKNYFRVNELRIHHLDAFKDPDVFRFLKAFKATEKRTELISDIIESDRYDPAWIDFEINEPGYLKQVTKGFCFVLDHLKARTPLDNDFIKKLHEICTSGVANLLPLTPGAFCDHSVMWRMTHDMDSLAGLVESLRYLTALEKNYGFSGIKLVLCYPRDYQGEFYTGFSDILENAKQCLRLIENGVMIYFKKYSSPEKPGILDIFTENLIFEFNDGIEKAKTETEKLWCIFAFIKFSVLHHPFADGVGRTYSMILLQYLLMRENLSPFLIFNSNIIPGYSVNQLISIYFEGRNEMRKILDAPSFISSSEFYDPNVATHDVLEKAPEELQQMFLECQQIWEGKVAECLEQPDVGSSLSVSSI